MTIIRNSAKCLKCGDEIESKHRHDFVQCSCGNVFVDGGKDYLRRGWNEAATILDTSVTKDDPPDEVIEFGTLEVLPDE